ncbi:MAG: glycosyltransferase family 39 protein [bacterium]|nr:glycosyltransferase family 39 protein [bacterium]
MRNSFLPSIVGILILAFLLRTIALTSYPVGFNPDEASFGYDAYSLLKTGKDQWGEPWPLTFRSFGDFKLPLYTYLTIPSVSIFGLSEFSTRLPGALLGTLAVLATFLLTTRLFRDRRLGILAALLLAISPWHISLSRGAFEANLTTFFIPLGAWAFLRGLKIPKWMVLSSFVFGINLFSYHSARLFTPLLVAVLIWFYRDGFTPLHKGVIKYKWALTTFLVFLVVAGYTMFLGAGERGADVAIFNPTDRWASVADRRYEAVLQGFPGFLERIFVNKGTYVFDQFIGGYFSYLSPQFLFTQGAGEWTYGMIPGRGVLYLVELPFILTAVWLFLKKRDPALSIIVLWILLSPIPAALAKGPGFAANRAAIMMPAIQILSAYGGIALFNALVKRSRISKRFLLSCYLVILFASLTFFLEDYRYHAPVQGAPSMLYGRRAATEFIKSVEDKYQGIIFSRSLSEPQIYVAFYKQWDPSDYQRDTPDWLRYEKEGRSFLDQLGEYRLGKYVFRGIGKTEGFGQLLVGKPEEFPQNIVALKTIYYPSGKTAILIVDPAVQVYANK